MAGLYTITLVLASWIFPPHGVWPLAFVCLVPWVVATCRTQRAWLVHWLSFALGWAFFLFNLRWLWPVTSGGHVALAFYLGLYWPVAAWALRTAQRHHISPVWTLPVAWVACEFLRATVMTGFPWLFLGHAFHAQLILIQISDITGAYGVSFLAALINGTIAAWILWRYRHPAMTRTPRQLLIGTGVTVVAVVLTLVYGHYRLRQTDFTPGPQVAVIQHDFSLRSAPPYGEHSWVIFAEYVALAAEAAKTQPDLLVFPETVWSSIQNREFLAVEHNAVPGLSAGTWHYGKICDDAISAFARGDYVAVNRQIEDLERFERKYTHRKLPRLPEAGGPPVTVVLGAQSVDVFPAETYPKFKRYNSVLVYDPDGTQREIRYDKNHLVPFGEFVPFRGGRLHFLYRWLNKLSPMSSGGTFEYSSSPGKDLTVFSLTTAKGDTRFGTPICYEDVMPDVMRRYVWDGGTRRTDFLVNVSNDGWYIYGNELPQHLAICAFRAVENRIGIARAVNTGISGFIDPNGRVYSVVEKDGRRYGAGIIGYRVDRVLLDKRTSIYGRFGDWLAITCLVLTAGLWAVAIAERWVMALQQRIAAWRAGGGRLHATTKDEK
ncbi:MAG: apolipoprotein N-acyltransferase [Phycisphaerae bacterium]